MCRNIILDKFWLLKLANINEIIYLNLFSYKLYNVGMRRAVWVDMGWVCCHTHHLPPLMTFHTTTHPTLPHYHQVHTHTHSIGADTKQNPWNHTLPYHPLIHIYACLLSLDTLANVLCLWSSNFFIQCSDK